MTRAARAVHSPDIGQLDDAGAGQRVPIRCVVYFSLHASSLIVSQRRQPCVEFCDELRSFRLVDVAVNHIDEQRLQRLHVMRGKRYLPPVGSANALNSCFASHLV